MDRALLKRWIQSRPCARAALEDARNDFVFATFAAAVVRGRTIVAGTPRRAWKNRAVQTKTAAGGDCDDCEGVGSGATYESQSESGTRADVRGGATRAAMQATAAAAE